jgi:hypothetical protein
LLLETLPLPASNFLVLAPHPYLASSCSSRLFLLPFNTLKITSLQAGIVFARSKQMPSRYFHPSDGAGLAV